MEDEAHKNSGVACALMFSPARMAGQTACPEEALARARNCCSRKMQYLPQGWLRRAHNDVLVERGRCGTWGLISGQK